MNSKMIKSQITVGSTFKFYNGSNSRQKGFISLLSISFISHSLPLLTKTNLGYTSSIIWLLWEKHFFVKIFEK